MIIAVVVVVILVAIVAWCVLELRPGADRKARDRAERRVRDESRAAERFPVGSIVRCEECGEDAAEVREAPFVSERRREVRALVACSACGVVGRRRLARLPSPPVTGGAPIGMFDSGVGGLTVLDACLVHLPHEDFVYVGDTGRFPYGPRSAEELQGYARELYALLEARGVKLVVVACNSATAAALPVLQREARLPVLGVVTPEARAAVQTTRNRRVGLLATEATVTSGRYDEAIHDLDAGIEVVAVACPGLAEAIQSEQPFTEHTLELVRAACAPLRDAGVDTAILGCTHYPLIRPMLQRELGPEVAIVAAAEELAREVAETLQRKRWGNDPGRRGAYSFLSTGDPREFETLGTRFLQHPLGSVQAISAHA